MPSVMLSRRSRPPQLTSDPLITIGAEAEPHRGVPSLYLGPRPRTRTREPSLTYLSLGSAKPTTEVVISQPKCSLLPNPQRRISPKLYYLTDFDSNLGTAIVKRWECQRFVFFWTSLLLNLTLILRSKFSRTVEIFFFSASKNNDLHAPA